MSISKKFTFSVGFSIAFIMFFLWSYFMGIPPRELESSLIVSGFMSTVVGIHTVWHKENFTRKGDKNA